MARRSSSSVRTDGIIDRHTGLRERWLNAARQMQRWDDGKRIRVALNDIRHTYAQTVHTSQGSTYDIAVLDMQDLRSSGMADPLTRQRLCYTAVTRPRMALGLLWPAQVGFI